MKKTILLSIFSFLLVAGATAQSEKYLNAMRKNLSTVGEAMKQQETLVALADNMERVAKAEKTEWLPYYYAAFFRVNAAFKLGNMEDADPIADAADKLLDEADKLSPNNSEISVVRAMVLTVRMLVSPQQRYMTMAPDVEKLLQTAMKQDPMNPRPYYFKGNSLRSTPEMFGGGCDAALKLLNTAKEKYSTFKSASDIAPNWGMEQTLETIQSCETK
jgi:hypothetical protein